MGIFDNALPFALTPPKAAPAPKPDAPHVKLESDLLSPLPRAQQQTQAQARFSFDADNLPLFRGK